MNSRAISSGLRESKLLTCPGPAIMQGKGAVKSQFLCNTFSIGFHPVNIKVSIKLGKGISPIASNRKTYLPINKTHYTEIFQCIY